MVTPELQKCFETLYAVFSDVTKPEAIDGCPCCIERKGVDVLLTTPLRQITPEQLTNYAASVFLTVGCVEDFLYFLPRILEISASDVSWWPNPEVIARALKEAEFDKWPDNHKIPILAFYDAALDNILKGDQAGVDIDSWICALGRIFPDVSLYLTKVERHPDRAVEYYAINRESLIKGQLVNSFWDDAPRSSYAQVIEWFNSKAIRDLIDTNYGVTDTTHCYE
jgi:hypothetical protein